MPSRSRTIRAALAASALASAALVVRPAGAQIKEPGAHPKYAVELEPHFVVQWTNTDWNNSDGIGVGARVSIPVISNGPVSTINNHLAVGFGFDWVHFDDDCFLFYGYRVAPAGGSCTANHFWFPIVAQWNFFFTPVVSAFGELGLAIQHGSSEVSCNDTQLGAGLCTGSANRTFTRVEPLFAVGPRFILTDAFAITIRLGIPSLTLGASFLL